MLAKLPRDTTMFRHITTWPRPQRAPFSSIIIKSSYKMCKESVPLSEQVCLESECSLPSMESITTHKRVNLTPSFFAHGCVCGHDFEFRDMIYETRRRKPRSFGVTIKPKTLPIKAGLKKFI